jgi:hypothetical protein
MTASSASNERVPPAAPARTRRPHPTIPQVLKMLATIIVGIPAILLGGLVVAVEEPQTGQSVLALGGAFVAILIVAWRWPVPGGVLMALFGLWREYAWFQNQLNGDIRAFVDSIGSVSPLWFSILAVVAGGLFAWAGLWRKPANP